MNKKTLRPVGYLLVFLVAISIMVSGCSSSKEKGQGTKNTEEKQETKDIFTVRDGEVIIAKSTGTNPVFGNSSTGEYTYGGDPSVLTDGDTVYLYTGHDMSSDDEVSRAVYNIPEYLCYSTTDMKNWKAEGAI